MPPKAKKQDETIEIPSLKIKMLELTLIGDSSLITHKWDEKAKREMLEKQQKKARAGKEVRDPQAEYEAALYRHPEGGYGFPIIAFKAAAVTVCSQIEGISKVFARQTFHVVGDELAKINGEPQMREDMVRIGMGTANLRFRPEFKEWHTTITIEYNSSAISEEQIRNMFNTAGFGVGIGEWRPEKDGRNGRFHVATDAEAARLVPKLGKIRDPDGVLQSSG